jgi:hypothetical protein
MFLQRDSLLLSIALIGTAAALWSYGGVLLTASLVGGPRRERFITGAAVGLLLYIASSNVLVRLASAPAGFLLSAILVFALGVIAAVSRKQRLPVPDRSELPYLVLFLASFYLAFVTDRGLSIQDDYHNLPLVSVMATGDIPPHFYLNAAYTFAYHYGLHVLAGALVNLGAFTPWSAFDLSKALTLGLALPLAALWVRRATSSFGRIAFGTATFALLGGIRWVLLLLPGSLLDTLSTHLTMLGSGAATAGTLHTALLRAWSIEGGGPLAFPFAFANGIRPPATFTLAGSALLPEVTLLVLLLLVRRSWTPSSVVLFAVLASSLALSSELLFLVTLLGLGIGLSAWVLLGSRRRWARPQTGPLLAVLLLSAALALIQGGVFTEIVRSLARRIAGLPPSSYYFGGVSFVLPPHIVSAHLGYLSVTDPGQLFLALLETGPAVLLIPFGLAWVSKYMRRGLSLRAGLIPASLAIAVVGLVVQYDPARETSHFIGTAVSVWIIMGLQPLTWFLRGSRGLAARVIVAALILGMVGGVVFLGVQLVAAARPVRSYFVDAQDEAVASLFWNRLPPDAVVFDPIPYRSVTLFGRPAYSYRSMWMPAGEFGRLMDNPSPTEIAEAGYRFAYLDETWWTQLTKEQRLEFTRGCAAVAYEADGPDGSFRRLYDLRACAPAPTAP